MKIQYTPEETAKYIAERNTKRNAERAERKPKLIWDSKKQGTYVGKLKDLINKKDEENVEAETTTEQ